MSRSILEAGRKSNTSPCFWPITEWKRAAVVFAPPVARSASMAEECRNAPAGGSVLAQMTLKTYKPEDVPLSRRPERGAGKLKAIFWLLVLAAGVFVAVKTVPAYVTDYQLKDKLQTEARFATVNRRTDEELRDLVFKEIQALEIPARREDIKILNSSAGVTISVEYTVPVDLKVYQLTLHFNPSANNRSL